MSAIPKGVALFLYWEPLLKNLIGKAAAGAIAANTPYRELSGNIQGLIVNPQSNPLCDVRMRLELPWIMQPIRPWIHPPCVGR